MEYARPTLQSRPGGSCSGMAGVLNEVDFPSCNQNIKWHVDNFIYPVALWFKHMPGASLCAMASPGGGIAVDPEGNCPVLKAWSDMDSVVARAAAHSKLTVTAGKLTRQTCIGNADVLVPLINATGGLPAFGLYQFVTVTRC